MQHIIKKQVIELQIDKTLDSFNIQQQVSNHFLQQIVPLLQKEFDALTNEDELLILDKMEIDLGKISAAEINNIKIDNVFVKKAVLQTTEYIKKEKILGSINSANTMPVNSYKQWFYYMQKGHLSWNVIQPNEKWYTNALQQLATDFESVASLRKEILANKTFTTRIVQEHNHRFLLQLVSIITSKNQDLLKDVVNEICIVLLKLKTAEPILDTIEKSTKNIIWQNVLAIAATGEIKTTFDISYELLKNNIIINQYREYDTSIKLLKEIKLLKPVLQQLLQEKVLIQKNIDSENVNKDKISGLGNEEVNILDNNKEELTKANVQIDEEGIFVALAGLILIHPFLSSFFGRLNLLENKQFINDLAKEKAVFILYYLATGNTVAAEHELVIPKMLCGLAVENTVSNTIALSHHEIEEADELLKAVIAQWSILKSTSPAGLRESFLQRNGKVFTKNDDIIIQVETSSIDMLLDHLPWGLNIIKLPWVNNIIRTEWR
jgi:hypothetical protein